MDPLTALGLGANVLQIVEFGVEIIKKTKIVFETGIEPDHDYLWAVAQDIDSVVEDIAHKFEVLTPLATTTSSLPPLLQLARQCQYEARALFSRIESYAPSKRQGLMGRWSSFRKVVKAYWDKNEVDSLEKRLNGYRAQLSIRMLAILNDKSDKQGSDIVEILSLTKSVGVSVEAIGAVLRGGDGSLQTLLSGSTRIDSDSVPDTYTYKNATESFAPRQSVDSNVDFDNNLASLTQVRFQKVADKILDTLWFREVPLRERRIDEAFTDTFEWVFREPRTQSHSWSSFPAWLEHENGCYWINGKAGSGKSTLMKFIGGHRMLTERLKKWAGSSELLVSSFYFWRAGQDLQKSQEGLLRSLLYQILDKRRELLVVCFPELCQKLSRKEVYQHDLSLSFDDLRLAFTRLLKHDIPNTKLFIMIDGLDEYQGDYRSLSDLVLRATKSKNTKVLVSSRPISLLVQAFEPYPHLEVHELTIGDISHYTTENLKGDLALKEMDVIDPGFSELLVASIVSKARGVFLWVVLVVRKVLDGLANYDTKEKILDALEGLPVDLDRLYEHMFNEMTPTHQAEASLMIQLFVRSEAVQFHYPMTALQLAFAENSGRNTRAEGREEFLSTNEQDSYLRTIQGRLRSRCCGLLEIQRSSWVSDDHKKYVGFLHRTVMDFFQRETIWTQVIGWNLDACKTLDELLLTASIKELRQDLSSRVNEGAGSGAPITQTNRGVVPNAPNFATRILHSFVYCGILQANGDGRVLPYVKQLWNMYLSLSGPKQRDVDKWAIQKSRHHKIDSSIIDFCQPVMMFAAVSGVGDFSTAPPRPSCPDPHCCSLILLNLLLHLNDSPTGTNVQQLAEAVYGLLDRGINPSVPSLYYPAIDTANEHEEIKTAVRLSPNQHNDIIPWIYWLSCKRQRTYIVVYHPRIYMKVLDRMIVAGATLQGYLGGAKTSKNETIISAVQDCLLLLYTNSREELDLRTRIQDHLRLATTSLSRRRSEISSASGTSWKSRFRFSRSSTLQF